jgi:hypothetical protein
MWAYKVPEELFTIKRYIGKTEYGYWKGAYYRNGEMFTPYQHKSHMFRSYDRAEWALKSSNFLHGATKMRYEIIRVE